ncbi:MAG: beta-ketoacyl-[acyl-carrier-protein] synthase family protein [Legionella sp.]
MLVVEDFEHAKKRKARIYAEILGVESSSDGCHLPQPSREDQALLIKKLLAKYQVTPEQIDYISAHATSTQLGDLTELNAIKDVFGEHVSSLKITAPKSILGHTCWSSAIVETVAAILQMNAGLLHPSVNIESLDPEVDLDVCANKVCEHQMNLMLNNSFGFGGLNSISLIKRYQPEALML